MILFSSLVTRPEHVDNDVWVSTCDFVSVVMSVMQVARNRHDHLP